MRQHGVGGVSKLTPSRRAERIVEMRVATEAAQLKEDLQLRKIRFGETPLPPEDEELMAGTMLNTDTKWSDLPLTTRDALGGQFRFATRVFDKMEGSTQSERDTVSDKLGFTFQREIQPSFRMAYGFKNVVAEMAEGVQNLFGATHGNVAEKTYIQKEIANNLYESYTNGTELASLAGEALPYAAGGGVSGALIKSIPLALGVDAAAQTGMALSEYGGSKDYNPDAAMQAGVDAGINAASFLLGRYGRNVISGIGSPRNQITKEEFLGDRPGKGSSLQAKADNQTRRASLIKAKGLADELGIKLFDVDGVLSRSGASELSSKMSDLNSLSKLNLGKQTAAGIKDFLNYYGKASDNFVKASGNNEFVGTTVGNDIVSYKRRLEQTYKDLYSESGEMFRDIDVQHEGGSMPKEPFFRSAELATIHTTPDVAEELRGFIEVIKNEQPELMTTSEVNRVAKTLKVRARDKAAGTQSSVAVKAYTDVADAINKHLEEVIPLSQFRGANKLYQERLDTFGYKDLGEGASNGNFIPKFLTTLESSPDKALRLINTPGRLKVVKGMVPDKTFNLLGRNKLENIIESATEREVPNLTKIAEGMESIPEGMMRGLFGDNADKLRDVQHLAALLGRRQSKGAGSADANVAKAFVEANLQNQTFSWLPSVFAAKSVMKALSKGRTLKDVASEVEKFGKDTLLFKSTGREVPEELSRQVQRQHPSGELKQPDAAEVIQKLTL